VSEHELKALHQELISRHVAWLTAFRHAMRQTRPWEYQMEHPTNKEWAEMIGVREHRYTLEDELKGDLSEADLAYVLSKSNKPTQILGLQSKRLRELRECDLLDCFRHMDHFARHRD
jgi:putative membrane protein